MRILFITPDDARYGFMLAGVEQHVISEGDTIDELNKIILMEDIGIVVIDERLLKDDDIEYIRNLEKRWRGVVVVLPSPTKPTTEGEDYVMRLIKKAIGYHVRLNL